MKYVYFFKSHPPLTETFRCCLRVYLYNMFQPLNGSFQVLNGSIKILIKVLLFASGRRRTFHSEFRFPVRRQPKTRRRSPLVVGLLPTRPIPVHPMPASLGLHGPALPLVLGERDVLRRIDTENHRRAFHTRSFWFR